MNTFIIIKSNKILKLIGVSAIMLLLSYQLTAQSFVLDLQYNQMMFTSGTTVSNTGNSGKNAGSVWRYDNIITSNGITVYALITILQTNNISIAQFDDDLVNGEAGRFQPRLENSGSGGGYVEYKIQYFNNADDTPVYLGDYWVTGVDIDGSSASTKEFLEISGYSSYQLDQSTLLSISNINGRTRFMGRSSSLGGITFDNTASVIANYQMASHEFIFALGISASYNSERLFSVQFGQKAGIFSNPNQYWGILPNAVDDIGTPVSSESGGIAINNVIVNDSVGNSETNLTEVNLSLVNAASHPGVVLNVSTGEVTVAPGTPAGTYNLVYKICLGSDCDVANITVEVVDGPDANNDNESTPLDTPVDIDVLNNDNNGSTQIDPTSVSFVSTTEPNPLTEGAFTVNSSTGLVTFTPVNGFTGTATIDYEVCDANNICDTATITVMVTQLNGLINYFPAGGTGTLAYEDLWPGKGDYDFNDLVLDYQFEIITDFSNYLVKVNGTFIIQAFGAGLENGFGFQLSDQINADDLVVTGSELTENYISLASNGTENGQSKPTIIVFDNSFNQMQHPGMGIGLNTDPPAPYITPDTIRVEITFPTSTYTFNELDISNFNPFLIVNKTRGHEIHLPDYTPTDLVDQGIFGTYEDDSKPSSGRYYRTENNLPWAINIYNSFDYPIEKREINTAHLKFIEWAESSGNVFRDWYLDFFGYRNKTNIYQKP